MRGLPPALMVDSTESYQPHAPHGGHGDDDSLEVYMKKASSLVPKIAESYAADIYSLFKAGRIEEARRSREQGIWRLMVADLSMSEATASRILSDEVRILMEA